MFASVLVIATPGWATVDLKSYVRRAVENSTDVKQAELNLANAELERTNSHRFFLPRLDLSSTLGKQESQPRFPYQPDTSQLALGLTSTLFDSWNSVYLWDQTNLKLRQARLSLEKTREAASLDAGKRFLAFSQSLLNNEIQRQSYDILKKQAHLVSSQFRQGLRTRKDDLRFQSQLRSAELSLAAGESDVAKTKNALRELDPELRPEELQAESPHADPSHEELRIVALADHRDRQLILLGQEIRGDQERIDHKRLGPDLTVKASANYALQDFTTPNPSLTQSESRSWNALLTVQWNLLDWGERHRQNEIILNNNRVEDQKDEASLRKLARDLADLAARANNARAAVRLSNELLHMEEVSYRQLEIDYREGKATYLDLITTLQDLTTARRQSSDAQFDWMNIRFESFYHEGRLHEQITR